MKRHSLSTRLLSALLVLVMVIGLCPVQALAAKTGTGISGGSSGSTSLSFSKVEGVDADVMLPQTQVSKDQQEEIYEDTDMVRVSIVLNKAATLELYPTAEVASNADAMEYRTQLQRDQETVVARIEEQVLQGQSLDVVWNLTLAANIISANIQYGQMEAIAAVRGVKEVFLENSYEPLSVDGETADPMMSNATQMTGATAAWAAGYTGAGSRIAIIDTGLDTDHQSFSSEGFLYALEQNAAAKNMSVEDYMASLDLMTAEDISAVMEELNIYPYVMYQSGTSTGAYYLNEKIPFAINYVDRDYEVTHDTDSQGGHGSHVAGIAAANSYIPSGDGFVSAVKEVAVQGVAPDAQLIIMKVFGKTGGAYESDYMVAIEDAVMLGCDVINLSLGTDKGFARSDTYQDILDSLSDSDVIVAVAAGNSGAWAEDSYSGTGDLYIEDVDFSMIGSPSAATNTLSVGSVDNSGQTNYYIQVGEQVIFYDKSQYSDYTPLPSLVEVAGNVNYIYLDGIGTAEEVAAVVEAEGGTIAPNTVLVCARGTINFAAKANNAIDAGFIATIVYNNVDGGLVMNMDGYEHTAPAVSVSLIDGLKLREAAQAVTGENGAEYRKGSMYISDSVTSVLSDADYQMSDFSSWGVPGSLEMKPEIVAPGGNIYSVDGEDPSGTAYMNNSGTSMASPQIAGMAALAMQYIKENGLDEKLGLTSRQLATSLLMSTATPLMDGENYYPVLQQGSGLANLSGLVQSKSYIMMRENATDSAFDGKVKVELGDDPDRLGVYSFTFDLNNFGEEAQIFSISGDFFTQAYYTQDGITYTSNRTTEMDMLLSYVMAGDCVNARDTLECDLNGDSVTDEQDAQLILEYVAGNLTAIGEAADVSGNGTVTSYDAHLVLAYLGAGCFVVQPGETATVTVYMTVSEEEKAHLNQVYTSGAYVEGYVSVKPLVTEEGETLPTHTIPVLGFYGNWSDASMFDRANYEDYLYADTEGSDFVFPYTGSLNYLTFFDEDYYEHSYVGNPYIIEDSFPTDKVAIRPGMEIGDMATSLIRNAAGFMFYVADADGNIVNSVSAPQLRASYYYENGMRWAWVNTAGLSIWQTPEQLGGFQDGDTFTIGFMAVPEYYETDGELTLEDLQALMASGQLGEGAFHSYTFAIDGTAPELLSVEKLEDGDLVIRAQDNRHIAAVAVLTASGGQVLTISGVEQDEINAVTETVIDMEGVRVNRNCLIMVADYAGNEVYYQLAYNEGLDDFDGRMYGFTNAKTRGTDNCWLEIDPETLYYYGGDASQGIAATHGGTMDVAEMDCAVIAAEYVGGYVYMITEENELRVAVQGEWGSSMLAAVDSAYSKIKDLAFNTADNKLYALGSNNTVYTLDLYTGALEKQYTVSISAPEGLNENGVSKTFTDEHKKLLTLAIDDEGNFYSVNNGDSAYQFVYLYTWSADDVTDGAVTGLTPVDNTYYGYAGTYVYNDDIPVTGSATVQSMAWDHDRDILYWAAALGAASPYNYLYTFDTATGKVSIVTEGPIDGVEDYCLGCLCVNVSGLYIVPEEAIVLDSDTVVTQLLMYRSDMTLLQGAQCRLEYDVLPWNLEDKGLLWTTSDASVATVAADGTITAVGVGTATVTATTTAAPYLSASCQITVNAIQDVSLNGMLYNAEGLIEWVNFDLLDSENWTGNFVTEDYQFLAGGLHGDTLYVHDGYNMYGVDANTFEVTDYGYVHESWLWSDAATGPKTPDGYFDRLVGIINDGQCIGVMDVERSAGYELSHFATFTEDRAAMIAYVSSTTYHDGFALRYGHEYYILTESGELYHDIIYAFYDADMGEVVYTDYMTHVGSTGLNLSGMADPTGGRNGSMYYDVENDYLIVTAYRRNTESASVYVFQPDACAPVEVGAFGVDVWPVVSLYSYSALNDLFVTVKPVEAECYQGETVQLNAKVYMAVSDQGVTWSSSDETVATVSKSGLVTGLKAGTVTITATTNETNDAGQQVTASATVTVKALDTLDLVFHAYIQTKNGGKWVAIDGNTLNFAELSSSDAVYTGALVSEGTIYATDTTYYYAIDPSGNTYAVTRGDNFTDADGAAFMYMLDGTAAPRQTVELYDFGTETRAQVEVGGTPVYLSGYAGGGYYLTLLQDYTTGQFMAAGIDADRCPAAIAYHGSEEIGSYWFDYYYVLSYDGMLQTYSFYGGILNGEMVVVDGGWELDYVTTGLVFEDGDDVSMTYVETEAFTGVVISHATENGVEFYSYDVKNMKLGKLGTLEGATDLVGLSLISEVDVTVPEFPDTPADPAEVDYLYGYIKTDSGYAWVKLNPETLKYEVLQEDSTGYTAGGVLDGMIYTVTGVTKYGNTTYSYQLVDPADDFAMDPNGGDTAYANYHPADFSGVPATQVTLVDSTTGQTVTAAMGGYLVHISNGKYSSSKPMTFMLTSHTTGDTELYTTSATFETHLAGIVYVGSELGQDGTTCEDHFLILDRQGNLYDYVVTSCVKNGKVTVNSAGQPTVTKLGSLDLTAQDGASMARMTEDLIYITVNGTDGVELYSYDLNTEVLTDLGIVDNALSLAVLYTELELNGQEQAGEPEQPEECEHADLNDWEYDGDGHWTTCAECGETVEWAEHSFEDGVCFCGYADPDYETACEHADLNDWEYDEDGHWTSCAECGETVEWAEHSFEDGVCFCGYADPDYETPAEPDEPAETVWLHGYISIDGGYAWVKINAATGEYEILATSDTQYGGGGADNGVIYVSDKTTTTVYKVEPANGYTATAGAKDQINEATMRDLASAPVKSVQLSGGTCQVGLPVHVGYSSGYGSSFVTLMNDYASQSANSYKELYILTSQVVAISFVSAELAANGNSYVEHFVVLFRNGNLYDLDVTYTASGATMSNVNTTTACVSTGLSISGGASMTLVSENLLYISVNTGSGVVLYSFDLTDNTATELATISDSTNLIALSLLGEARPDLTGTCTHTNVGGWEYDENSHWKTCVCGEKLEQDQHSFTAGVCACGYTDPSYVPVDPADAVWLHGYVKVGSSYAWAKINAATGEYEVLASGSTQYSGGGLADGMLYVSGGTTVYQIDPANGYAATAGAFDYMNYAVLRDLACAPVKSVALSSGTCQVGLPVFVSYSASYGTQYVTVMSDYADLWANTTNEIYVSASQVAAIAFVSAELADDGGSYTEHFVVLFRNGNLYGLDVTYTSGGFSVSAINSLTEYVSTGLTTTSGASMTLVSENLLYISLDTGSGVELYSFDLTTNVASKLCSVSEATTLVALSLLSEVEAAQTLSLSAAAEDGAVAETANENVTFADGNVTVDLRENASNGKLTLTFDPSVLTYVGMSSDSVYYAVNDSQAASGTLIIAYAAAGEISARDILASVCFRCSGEYVDTVITVTTSQRNEKDGLTETQQIVVNNVPCRHTETEVRGAYDATCDQPGYTGDTYCTECGELVASGEALPATGHSYVDGVCEHCGQEHTLLLGDANSDGVINHLDAMLIAQYYVGAVSEDAIVLAAADVNGDGVINHLDAMMVAQFYVGAISEFPTAAP